MRIFLLTAGLCLDAGALVYYKYAGFFLRTLGIGDVLGEVILPLGISFFTFQAAAYLIDVYKRETKAEKNIFTFAAFILLFPQLIAGPILRYSSLSARLHEKRRPGAGMLEKGMTLFLCGLTLKVLLANPLGEARELTAAVGEDSLCTWLSAIAFMLQIYFDFYGYSLMAIGMGNMLGLQFEHNFRDPYSAVSATDFWRRWHITLSHWFRDYVYIPLGGSRKGLVRTLLNLLVVWLLTGLWHGAGWNFVLWGGYWFVLLSLEKLGAEKLLMKNRVISRAVTLFFILIGWMIFSSEELSLLPGQLQSMFAFSFTQNGLLYLREFAGVFLAAVLLCIPKIRIFAGRMLVKNTLIRCSVLICVLILCLCALANTTYNPFLYFRF